jgi:hypothetical protein
VTFVPSFTASLAPTMAAATRATRSAMEIPRRAVGHRRECVDNCAVRPVAPGHHRTGARPDPTGTAVWMDSRNEHASKRIGLGFGERETEESKAQTGVEVLTGTWTYRGFHDHPTYRFGECQQCADLAPIVFGQADLIIKNVQPAELRSRLVFQPGTEMTLLGASSFGNPFTIRFQGGA